MKRKRLTGRSGPISLFSICDNNDFCCIHLAACRQLERQRWIDALPIWTPIGWLIECPDGFKEKLLPFEVEMLGEYYT